jgi:hypothetical protein
MIGLVGGEWITPDQADNSDSRSRQEGTFRIGPASIRLSVLARPCFVEMRISWFKKSFLVM